LTGKQKIHVFVTAQTAIYHCTIASYHCTFCVSLHTILCPDILYTVYNATVTNIKLSCSDEIYFELSGTTLCRPDFRTGIPWNSTKSYRMSEVCGKIRVHSVDRSHSLKPTAIRRCTEWVYNFVYVDCTENHCSRFQRYWNKLCDRRP